MKENRFDWLMVILIVLIACMFVFYLFSLASNSAFRGQCLDNNKTYFEFTTAEFPLTGKYCGNLNEVKEILIQMEKIK